MGAILITFAIILVYLSQMQGSTAVTHVFVQKGKDVLLNAVTNDVLETDAVVSWFFNKDSVLVRFLPNGKPTVSNGRIEFSGKNYSLKLKHLQEADSGVYTAQVLGAKKQLTTEYNVTVQDPVSPVELKVDSVFNSSDSCNVTVTCSTQDSHLSSTFRCDTKTCRQEGGDRSEVTTAGASVHVYLVNDSVICNHSNQVSWTKDSEIAGHLCTQYESAHHVYIPISIMVTGLPILIAAAIVFYRKRRKHKSEDDNTVYAVPQMDPLDSTNDVSGVSSSHIYSLVKPHTEPIGPTETRDDALPESLYAEIEKTGRS